MARPRKAPEELRLDGPNPRLTTAERAQIAFAAASLGLTPSDFMRRRALSYRLPAPSAEARQRSHAIAELNRLGVNLNQIARHMNAGRPPPPDLAALIARIDAELTRLVHGPGDSGRGPVL